MQPAFLSLLLLGWSSARKFRFDPSSTEFQNKTIWQTLRTIARSDDPQFIGIAAALQGNCTAKLREYLDNPNETMTLFAPYDDAFVNFFPERTPLRYIGCGDGMCEGTMTTIGEKGFDPVLVKNCLTEMASYHIIPGLQFIALERLGNVSEVVTVLPTMLNSTSAPSLVKLDANNSQSLVVNQTASGFLVNQRVNFGVLPPAKIIYKNITCLNGIIQGIDRVLIPPPNLYQSLQVLNPGNSWNALRTPDLAQPVMSMSNATIFLPMSGFELRSPAEALLRSTSSLYNYTEYVTNQRVLFNNQTNGSLNLTMVNGVERNVTFGQNYTMHMDGVKVLLSNILVKNGVLHLLERPLPSITSNITALAR
jgi:uncharacterized surface protein with fasciclin (FAS1) repeats